MRHASSNAWARGSQVRSKLSGRPLDDRRGGTLQTWTEDPIPTRRDRRNRRGGPVLHVPTSFARLLRMLHEASH
jgi:hypothetical protein